MLQGAVKKKKNKKKKKAAGAVESGEGDGDLAQPAPISLDDKVTNEVAASKAPDEVEDEEGGATGTGRHHA